MKRFLIVFLLFYASAVVCAQQPGAVQRSEVIEMMDGKEYYIHLVRQGQTMESIAAAYQLSVADINRENPRLKGIITTGDVMKIPKDMGAIGSAENSPKAEATSDQKPQTIPVPSKTPATPKANSHTVTAQETFFGIARQYSITVPELRAANPGITELQPGQVLVIPEKGSEVIVQSKPEEKQAEQPKPGSIPETYTVQAGETLFSISRRFNMTVEEINNLNPGLTDGLKAGQTIRLKNFHGTQEPQYKTIQDTTVTYTYHRVRRGETLFRIGKRYGVSADELIKHNPHAAEGLQPKQVLQIPVYNITTKKVLQEIKPPVEEEVPEIPGPGIPEDCHPLVEHGKTYNIALMLPFFLDAKVEFPTSDSLTGEEQSLNKSYEFMQFYYGAMLAIDSLGKLGLNATVHVYDVDNTPESVDKVLARSELSNMDLIIGPLFSGNFDKMARFAASNKINIVNPLSTRTEFLLNNPYSIKAQSSSKDQVHVLASFIKNNFAGKNIIVVRQFSFSENETSEIFRKEFGEAGLNEVIYIRDSLDGVRRSLSKTRENIIVGLSTDKVFIMDFIRKLNDIRADYDITCFGMQEWEEFEIDTEHIVNLRLHLPSHSYIDYNAEPVKNYIRLFRNTYNTEPLPNRFAFEAFDITWYFVSAMMKYGAAFEECLPSYRYRGMQIPFSFEPLGRNGFENKGLSIYRIQDFRQIEVYPK
ncbi:MAG: LysM peptidoglycan-binding domain-containing protein [Bacteroidales bacterium]|nr:LysM peptidoglycan-binding domain-containing protein [Bacteroidales bacterium]